MSERYQMTNAPWLGDAHRILAQGLVDASIRSAGEIARHSGCNSKGSTRKTVMTKQTESNSTTPIVRTSAGLRDAIFDEIDAIRGGTSNPTRANAVAKLATGIVETVRMEIEVQRHLRQHAGKPETVASSALGAPLALGATG